MTSRILHAARGGSQGRFVRPGFGARDGRWTLEALDWTTGEPAFHYIVGGQRYNSLFSGTLLDEAGRIHYGTPWGRVRLDPASESD